MQPHFEPIIGIHNYKIISTDKKGIIEIKVEYVGQKQCPFCLCSNLRKKDSFWRKIRHNCIGIEKSYLLIKSHKFKCRSCLKYFNQRLPGVLPRFQSTQPFREEIALNHHWGVTRAMSGKVLGVSPSNVERCYKAYLKQKNSHRKNAHCPRVLGIDEKHFTKKAGYMTTLADLRKHKVFDLQLGRSEGSLQSYLNKMPKKENCRVVVMDLSETYRSIARKYFLNALIVADRFHVVKLVNYHFLKTWTDLDDVGRRNRGLLSLMRRHEENLKPEQRIRLRRYLKTVPGLEAIYDFKQHLMKLVLIKETHKHKIKEAVPHFLNAIRMLKESGFRHLKTLGETLESWKEEIARMWRFKKTNSITEGLHNRMEEIIRRAYGFRNFENFRLRILEYCS